MFCVPCSLLGPEIHVSVLKVDQKNQLIYPGTEKRFRVVSTFSLSGVTPEKGFESKGRNPFDT